MQKTILVLALVFTCVLADGTNITWNTNNTKNDSLWASEPTQIINDKDTNFTGKDIELGFVTNNIILRARNQNNNTDDIRNITIKDLSFKNSTDEVISAYKNDKTTSLKFVADGVFLYGLIENDDQGISQVRLVKFKTAYENSGDIIPITKATSEDKVTFAVQQVFAHRGRYFIVYSANNGTVWVSSVATDGNKPETVVLSTDADSTYQAKCIGLTGKDTLYCNWLQKNNTEFFFAEATLEPLKNTTSNASNITDANVKPDEFFTFNAGKQYGCVFRVSDKYQVRNYASNKTFNLTPMATPVTYVKASIVKTIEYLDDIALFWEFSLPTSTLRASGVQYVTPEGDASNNSTVYEGFTDSDYIQYKDGSAFLLARNTTDAYLGKLWGDTKLSGSVLQTALVGLFALFAGLILA